MKTKFKELRMFVLCLGLFFIFIVGGMILLFNHEMKKGIIMLVLSFIALTMLIGRFNIILFDDSLMYYEFLYIAMLPSLIYYEDIESVQKKSKHKVLIKHKKKSHIYVADSEQFISSLEEMRKHI